MIIQANGNVFVIFLFKLVCRILFFLAKQIQAGILAVDEQIDIFISRNPARMRADRSAKS